MKTYSNNDKKQITKNNKKNATQINCNVCYRIEFIKKKENIYCITHSHTH